MFAPHKNVNTVNLTCEMMVFLFCCYLNIFRIVCNGWGRALMQYFRMGCKIKKVGCEPLPKMKFQCFTVCLQYQGRKRLTSFTLTPPFIYIPVVGGGPCWLLVVFAEPLASDLAGCSILALGLLFSSFCTSVFFALGGWVPTVPFISPPLDSLMTGTAASW